MNNISIVIPTYNRVDSLKKVLPYYVVQKNIKEIIIVDDNSSDGTEVFIRENYPDFLYIKLNQRMGAPYAKQVGLDYSSADYVLFGEDDLFFDDNYSSCLLENLEKTDSDLIAGRILYLNPNESKEEVLERFDFAENCLYDKNFNHKFYSKSTDNIDVLFLHGCFMGKKSVLKKFKYDINYKRNGWREETDFIIQIKFAGYKVTFCPFTQCYHLPRYLEVGGQHSSTRLNYEYWVYKNNMRFLYKFRSQFKKIGIIKIHPFMTNLIFIFNRYTKLLRDKFMTKKAVKK